MGPQAEDFDRLAHMKAEAKRLQDEADAAKKAAKDYEQDLWDRASEGSTFGMRTGTARYELKKTQFGTVADKEAFETWVHDQGLEDEYLTTKEVSGRLNELVRERLETNQALPEGVGWYERRYISVTQNKED